MHGKNLGARYVKSRKAIHQRTDGERKVSRVAPSFLMLTDDVYRAGLWTFSPLLLGQAHLGPNRQTVEAGCQHTVAVEIDLPAVRCFQEAIALVPKEFRNT